MTRCFEPREIAAALDLPEGDPGRRHLADCPRCRSLALAFAEFMEAPPEREPEFDRTDDELRLRLARAFGPPAPAAVPRRRMLPPRSVWVATAAVAATMAVVLLSGDLDRLGADRLPVPGGTLRGGDQATGLAAVRQDAGLILRWERDPAADQAVLVFYDAHMHELGRRTTDAPGLTVPAGQPLAAAAYCQLLFVAAGDTVSRSAIVAPRPARE